MICKEREDLCPGYLDQLRRGGNAKHIAIEMFCQESIACFDDNGMPSPMEAHLGDALTPQAAALLEMVLIPGGAEARLAEAGDQVLLVKSIGLDAQAAKIGARTLMADDRWQEAVSDAIANPNTRISVSLDGVNGSSAYGKVMGAAQRGVSGAGTPFDWEMGQLYSNRALGDVTFYEGGNVVANPFG